MPYIEETYAEYYDIDEDCRALLFNGLHEMRTTRDLCRDIPYKEPCLRILISNDQDDKYRLPHCHVIRGYMENPSSHCCIRLDANKYYRNNHGTEDTLSDEDLKIFNEFMLSMKNCPTQHLDSTEWSIKYFNYRRIWNSPFPDFCKFITNFPMPDYSVILEDDDSTKILEEELKLTLMSK